MNLKYTLKAMSKFSMTNVREKVGREWINLFVESLVIGGLISVIGKKSDCVLGAMKLKDGPIDSVCGNRASV